MKKELPIKMGVLGFKFSQLCSTKSLFLNNRNELDHWVFVIPVQFCIATDFTSHGGGRRTCPVVRSKRVFRKKKGYFSETLTGQKATAAVDRWEYTGMGSLTQNEEQ